MVGQKSVYNNAEEVFRVDLLNRRQLTSGGAALAMIAGLGGCGDLGKAKNITERSVDEVSVIACEKLLALEDVLDEEERAQVILSIDDQLESINAIRGVSFDNGDAPALVFDPRLPGEVYVSQRGGVKGVVASRGDLPGSDEDVAFAPIVELAYLISTGKITSLELTEIYLSRIARYNELLKNFITVTPELARKQARRADKEIAAGKYRGPLHGIPYGLKDIIDTKDILTTWGATPYKERVAKRDAWIVTALKEAGAVLLGKTTNGALASGDLWYGGITRNPWFPLEGSSGSSAGSASATAAGMCAFAIGTETRGSIISPANRCGATGLRPTFGRVPRSGAMALSWSLDKIGPICRSVADTALVLSAINGHNPVEPGSIDHGLEWDGSETVSGLRVGYDPSWFEDANAVDKAALEAARKLPVEMVEISMPEFATEALVPQLYAESAAAFQKLTLENIDEALLGQANNDWPNEWRRVHFYSAVDLVQVDRLRRRAMEIMREQMAEVDIMLGPNFAGGMLVITNYTGHPCLTLRAGFHNRAPNPLKEGEIQQDRSQRRSYGDSDQSAVLEGSKKISAPRNVSLWAPIFEERRLFRMGAALEDILGVACERPQLEHWGQELGYF